ncbi:hypothetical protein KU855_18540 [Shewanella sp. NIFS-20-20]|nr:hypothetical protein [Shewanella sp. NIFS-20-20]
MQGRDNGFQEGFLLVQPQVSNITEQWTISASQRVVSDPLLDSLLLLTEYFGNPCSSDSLAAGLPLTAALITPDLLPQAASRAGLTAKLFRKNLNQINEIMLPCILLLKDKQACVLREIDVTADMVIIQLPETGGEQVMTIEELETLYVGYLFLIKQQYRSDKAMDAYLHDSTSHWLWKTG